MYVCATHEQSDGVIASEGPRPSLVALDLAANAPEKGHDLKNMATYKYSDRWASPPMVTSMCRQSHQDKTDALRGSGMRQATKRRRTSPNAAGIPLYTLPAPHACTSPFAARHASLPKLSDPASFAAPPPRVRGKVKIYCPLSHGARGPGADGSVPHGSPKEQSITRSTEEGQGRMVMAASSGSPGLATPSKVGRTCHGRHAEWLCPPTPNVRRSMEMWPLWISLMAKYGVQWSMDVLCTVLMSGVYSVEVHCAFGENF